MNRFENRPGSAPLLIVRGLKKAYSRRSNLWSRHVEAVQAISGVDLEVARGSTLAVVGQSGSGKSTLATCIAQLEQPDAGEIWFDGTALATLKPAQLGAYRRRIQLIFQDSAQALNPRMRVNEIIAEPLEIARAGNKSGRHSTVAKVMEMVALSPDLGKRSALQLSGGQRQRVAIARAMVLNPELLIFDEAFSGLDLIVQEEIIGLLHSLQAARGLTYIIIAHDFGFSCQIASHMAVMNEGKIVEQGETRQIVTNPMAPQTKVLLASIPRFPRHIATAGGQV